MISASTVALRQVIVQIKRMIQRRTLVKNPTIPPRFAVVLRRAAPRARFLAAGFVLGLLGFVLAFVGRALRPE